MDTANKNAAEAAFKGVITEKDTFLYQGEPQNALVIRQSRNNKEQHQINFHGDPMEVADMLMRCMKQEKTLFGGTFIIRVDLKKTKSRVRRFKVAFLLKEGTNDLLPSWPFTKSKPFEGHENIVLEDERTGARHKYQAIMDAEGNIELIAQERRGFFRSKPAHRKFTRDGVPIEE